MSINSKIKEEDFLDDNDFFYSEEETQSNINYLKKNLTERSLYTQLFNNFNFNEIMNQLQKQENEQNEIVNNKIEENEEDQIHKTKYNMYMVLYNECDFPKEDQSKFKKSFDNMKNLLSRKLIIQYCGVVNTKLLEKKKQYYYIPITDQILYHHNNEIIAITKERINNKKITTLSIFDKSEYNNIIKLFAKSKKKEESKVKSKYEVLRESEFKEKFEKDYEEEFKYLQNHKNHTSNSAQSGQQLSVKTDNSENEVNGERFYVVGDKEIMRFIFTNSYKKDIDGFYSRHKEINLGIDTEVNNFDDSLINYDINNDLQAHILFKNFKGRIIPKDKPIILEIKKSFKIYDLLTQIKQISKMANNFYEIDGKKNLDFPEYIIGIMCNNRDEIEKQSNLNKINELYKNTNISLLQHDIDIIKKNKVKVIICAIKDEKVLGYDLSKPDYDIEGSNAQYQVDVFYLSQLIFPNENKMDFNNKIIEEYQDRYKSLAKGKDPKVIIKNQENEIRILKSQLETEKHSKGDIEAELNKYLIIIKQLQDQNLKLTNELKNIKEKKKFLEERLSQKDENKNSLSSKNINEEEEESSVKIG